MIDDSTCIVGISMLHADVAHLCYIGVGLLSYLHHGYAKTSLWDKTKHDSHTFVVPLTVLPGIEEHKKQLFAYGYFAKWLHTKRC